MLEYQLVQEQKYKLVMTPEMKQSLHLLMLPGYELFSFLREQMLNNPLLELEEPYEPRYLNRSSKRLSRETGEFDPLWSAKENGQTLEQFVIDQLRLLSLPPEIRQVAVFLAGNLNDSGYLDIELSEVCERLNVSYEQAAFALKQLQALDPAGIGSRDLRECLLLQISRDPLSVPYADRIVACYLDDAAYMRISSMTKGLGILKQEAAAAIRYIQSLNPRPGQQIGAVDYTYVVPDAVVEDSSGGVVISLHAANQPKLQLNSDYLTLMRKLDGGDEAILLGHWFQSARWLIRCIEQRKQTLLRVIHAIMEEQRSFVVNGMKALRPMTLSDIAVRLDLHESTISRAVQEKYIMTPHGVFALRSFFTTRLATSDGSDASSHTVKVRIKEFIDQENKQCPLSDQKLAALLSSEGIQISRRTVAKYREEMKLSSSSKRKRMTL